jgi:hypothetical protein
MTVVPKIAQNTILSDSTETFFNDIIEKHLAMADELGMSVYIRGTTGSPDIRLYNEKEDTIVTIPKGDVKSAYINDELEDGLEYRIYFYPDGVFDHFRLVFGDKEEIEGIPILHKAVTR